MTITEHARLDEQTQAQRAQEHRESYVQLQTIARTAVQRSPDFRARVHRLATVTGQSGAAYAYTHEALGAFDAAISTVRPLLARPADALGEADLKQATNVLQGAMSRLEDTLNQWWHTVELHDQREQDQRNIDNAQQQVMRELDGRLPAHIQSTIEQARAEFKQAEADHQQAQAALTEHERRLPAERSGVGEWAADRARLQAELTAYGELSGKARQHLVEVENSVANTRRNAWQSRMRELQAQVEREHNTTRAHIEDLQRQMEQARDASAARLRAIAQEMRRWELIQPN